MDMNDTNVPLLPPRFSSIFGKLPTYDGKTPIIEFLKEINKRAKVEEWPETHAVNILKFQLRGVAEQHVEELLDRKPNLTYDEIISALKQRFSYKISSCDAYVGLTSIIQGNKSINEYSGAIMEAGQELGTVVSHMKDLKKREELMFAVFMDGLNSKLKQMLATSQCSSLEEGIDIARRCEKIIQQVETDVAPKQKNLRALAYVNQVSPLRPRYTYSNPIVCWECGVTGHTRKLCPRYQEPLSHGARYNWYPAQASNMYQNPPTRPQFSYPPPARSFFRPQMTYYPPHTHFNERQVQWEQSSRNQGLENENSTRYSKN